MNGLTPEQMSQATHRNHAKESPMSNGTVPRNESPSGWWSNVSWLAICVIGGLAGGALAYPLLVDRSAPAIGQAPADVQLRAVADPARGITCYVSSLGGVSCVPDQWFLPPPDVKPQSNVSPIRGWDL